MVPIWLICTIVFLIDFEFMKKNLLMRPESIKNTMVQIWLICTIVFLINLEF